MHSASAGRHTTARRTYSSAVDTLDTVLPTAVRPPLVCTWTCSTLTVGIAGRNADRRGFCRSRVAHVRVLASRFWPQFSTVHEFWGASVGFPGFSRVFYFRKRQVRETTIDHIRSGVPLQALKSVRQMPNTRYKAGSDLPRRNCPRFRDLGPTRFDMHLTCSGTSTSAQPLVRRRQPRPEKLLCWGTALLPTTPDGVATAHVVALLLGEGERHAQGAVGGGARGRIVCRCPLLSNLPHVQRVDLRRRLLLPR